MQNNVVSFTLDENSMSTITVKRYKCRRITYGLTLTMTVLCDGYPKELVLNDLADINTALGFLGFKKMSQKDAEMLTEYVGNRTDNKSYKHYEDTVESYGTMCVKVKNVVNRFYINGNPEYDLDADGTKNSDELYASTFEELLQKVEEKENKINA